MNQLTLSGNASRETGISTALTPAAADTPKPSQDHRYTEDDLFRLIKTDMHIFDMRCWPGSITKQEFFKRWNNGFSGSPLAERDDDWWNAGHFAHVLRDLKNTGRIDPEDIWQAFLEHRETHLRELVKTWKQNAEWEFRVASNARTVDDCEQWLFYTQRSWNDMNRCLQELGLPEQPLPPEYTSVYPDPVYWGEEQKQERKKKKKEE
ncbi:MAG: hypothetical protein SCH70_06865 [Candidatus Methanoperedens sp.]|nr:hypothetical protein [Candidatus Methanoperedens sp.]